MDEAHMLRALALAERGRGLVSPNPLVGAVLVRDGRVVGEGWHKGPGTPHAEVVAMEAAGDLARGATMYATLEPCSHFGRTPPCAPRLVGSGVKRLVVAIGDPNPQVDGRGLAVARNGGIEVEVGLLAAQATRQNEAFLRHVDTGRPFVTLKMAASLDGKVAARDGSSRWITGEGARADVHRMRAGSDAILVGAGTAFRDDPKLTVRTPGYEGRPPVRVVVDGRGILPVTHRLLADDVAPTVIATTEGAPSEVREAWRAAGAEVLVLDDAGSALIPLEALLTELGKRDVQSVLCEGGPTLAWEFVSRGLADRVVIYLAPTLIGGKDAPSLLMGAGAPNIDSALPLDIEEFRMVGSDLKVVGRVHRDS